jgi:hypothetical protein
MRKGTEEWHRVDALADMAAAWKKTPDKWAPHGSVYKEYGRRAPHKNFSRNSNKPPIDFWLKKNS